MGYTSWLEYASRELPDDQFREWLLNQVRSRRPFGGRDPQIDIVLHPPEELIKEALPKNVEIEAHPGRQKVTHQHAELQDHHVNAALTVETDILAATAYEDGFDQDYIKDLRSGIRLAMLHHDFGKLGQSGVETPGVHEGLGAKMWRSLKPAWAN